MRQKDEERIDFMARRGHGDGSIYKRSDGRWAAGYDVRRRNKKNLLWEDKKGGPRKIKSGPL